MCTLASSPEQVSPATFAHFTHTLMGVAEVSGGRVCAVLEGGYFPPSLAEGAALTLRLTLTFGSSGTCYFVD